MDSSVKVIHHNDWDGLWSAWLISETYKGNTKCIPTDYNEPMPKLKQGDRVFIVDFSYPRSTMVHMAEELGEENITLLDHHESAMRDLEGLDYCHFDMDLSGVGMTWDWLSENEKMRFEKVASNPKIHPLTMYIQDRDLYKFELPESRGITDAIHAYPKTFFGIDMVLNAGLSNLSIQGKGIRLYKQNSIDQHIQKSHKITLGNYVGLACACTDMDMISDVAGELSKYADFGCCYYDDVRNTTHFRTYSLRSSGDKPMNVADLAKSYGGGGHACAAGFKVPVVVVPVLHKQ